MCVLWMLACRLTTLSMTLMNGDVLDDKKYGHSSSGCFAFGWGSNDDSVRRWIRYEWRRGRTGTPSFDGDQTWIRTRRSWAGSDVKSLMTQPGVQAREGTSVEPKVEGIL